MKNTEMIKILKRMDLKFKIERIDIILNELSICPCNNTMLDLSLSCGCYAINDEEVGWYFPFTCLNHKYLED